MQTYPSGYGARLLSECALHAQVRTLPSACILPKVTSDGIEPPLSDLESEVLPLHHEADGDERSPSTNPSKQQQNNVEMQGIDPCTSRMLSERSTI